MSTALNEKPVKDVQGAGSSDEKPIDDVQGAGSSDAQSLTDDEAFTNPTGINEKALVRRLDYKLLPPLTLLYLLSFLDRSNSTSPYPRSRLER